jgi:uncharacterized membrane protein
MYTIYMRHSVVVKSLLPLVLLTSWSSFLTFFRLTFAGPMYYDFLLWNAFLAWIPLFISTYLFWTIYEKKQKMRSSVFLVLFFSWLVFLPNAPYLLTDFVHLAPRSGVPLWYDVMLLFSFALLGLFQFEYSLIHIRQVIRRRWHVVLHVWFVPLILLLMSIGLYVGRFLRWNSWYIVTQPATLVSDIKMIVTQPSEYVVAGGYIVGTAILLGLFHYLLHTVRDILMHE